MAMDECHSRIDGHFVGRFLGLPVMASAAAQLTNLYSSTKERNRLLKVTMETAESGVGLFVSRAMPVVSRFDRQIVALDSVACAQLDRLETNYPIITRPTEEVMKETREMCCGAVRPLVQVIGSVKQYGSDKVTGFRTYTGDKISGMKKSGMNAAAAVSNVGSNQLTRIMSCRACRGVVSTAGTALDMADYVVDKCLPDDESCESGSELRSVTSDAVLLNKACQLGCKVQRRAMKRLRKADFRPKAVISRLHVVITDLVEYSRSSLNGTTKKVQFIWQEVNKSEDQIAEEVTQEHLTYQDSTYERRIIATIRQLITRLKKALAVYSEKSASAVSPGPLVSEAARGELTDLQDMTQTLADIFSKRSVTVLGDLVTSALNLALTTTSQMLGAASRLMDCSTASASGVKLLHSNMTFSVALGRLPYVDDGHFPVDERTEEDQQPSLSRDQSHNNDSSWNSLVMEQSKNFIEGKNEDYEESADDEEEEDELQYSNDLEERRNDEQESGTREDRAPEEVYYHQEDQESPLHDQPSSDEDIGENKEVDGLKGEKDQQLEKDQENMNDQYGSQETEENQELEENMNADSDQQRNDSLDSQTDQPEIDSQESRTFQKPDDSLNDIQLEMDQETEIRPSSSEVGEVGEDEEGVSEVEHQDKGDD